MGKVKKETKAQFIARIEAERAKFLEANEKKEWMNPKHKPNNQKKKKLKEANKEEAKEEDEEQIVDPEETERREAEEKMRALKPPRDHHGKPVFSWHFFLPADSILLLGEGNFSFALSLARTLEGRGKAIYATTVDSEEECVAKYPESGGIFGELRALGVSVHFDVDAMDPSASRAVLSDISVDCCVFMFPHVGLGIDDQQKNVMANRRLLEGAFATADAFLREGGQLAVTLKTGMPYDSWNVVGLGSKGGWKQTSTLVFQAPRWKGYEFRRTKGVLHGEAKNAHVRAATCRTFVFERKADLVEREGSAAVRSKEQERKERERFIAMRPSRGKKNKRKLIKELEKKEKRKRKRSSVEIDEEKIDLEDDKLINKLKTKL